MTIQAKTTFLFTLLTLAVFLILTATVYYFSNQFAYNDFYKRLELRVRITAKFTFESELEGTASFKQLHQQYLERLADEKSYVIQLSADEKPVYRNQKKFALSYINAIKNANGNTVYYHENLVHYAGLLYKDETGNFLVIESATNSYGAEVITRLRNILIVTLIASVIIIFSVGKYFSNRTFKPFRDITHRVQQISERNLQLRLDEIKGTDEIAELINTFNQMLDRLQTAFETQNNFVSNASHELRTPLTAIIAEADYALTKERNADVYKQSLQNILQQSEKLQHLTKGLLSLAQTGYDGNKQLWETIKIDELLFDIKDNVEEIFPKSNIIIYVDELNEKSNHITVYGNKDLLNIAIGNIMMNACKYSNNQPVSVSLSSHNKNIIIAIADKGIGIPEKEIQNIKNPFFRASNTKSFEGHGIGLPLSNNIIRLHKGTIAVHSEINKGTEVVVVLPAYQEKINQQLIKF